MKHAISILFLFLALNVFAQEQCPDTMFTLYHQGSGGTILAYPTANCMEYNVSATPVSDEYVFLYWSDSVTSNPRTFLASSTKDKKLRAVFGKKSDLHFTAGNVRSQLVNNDLPSYLLTVETGSCAEFSKWNNDSTTTTISYLESDGTRIPVFSYNDLLQRRSGDEIGGEIVVTPLTCGFTLTATPKGSYHFAYWEDDRSSNPIRDVDYIDSMYIAYFAEGVAIKDNVPFSTLQSAIDDEIDHSITMLDDANENVEISKSVTLDAQGYEIGDLTITNSGDLTLTSALIAKDLYLNTVQESSSQLKNADNLSYNDAYMNLRLEPMSDVADPDKYYAFSVPFEVAIPARKAVSTTVTRANAPSQPTTNFVDYLIWKYDGELRAQSKENGWVKVEDESLSPGNFYMIGIAGTQNIWRFKKTGNDLGGNATLHANTYDSDCQNRGWNGLANSQLYYAVTVVDTLQYAQVYDNNSNSGKYDVIRLDNHAFVMASPFFIQVERETDLSLMANTDDNNILHAPTRMEDDKVICRVELSNGRQHDALYLTANNEATTNYQIGKDVVKMMGGTTDSYIWANGYNYRLCAHDLPWVDGIAEFDITLYAASSGEFTLSANMGELYYKGNFQTDLAQGTYTIHLNKGSNVGYTIRLGQRQLSTNISKEEESQGKNEKFILDNTLYIQHNGHFFNAQGNKLK